jgi:hypothetical protein
MADNPNELVNYNIDYKNWNIKQCQGPWLWLLMVDEPDSEYITLGSGLQVKTQEHVKNAFRVVKVIKSGPDCKVAKEGDFVLIPPGNFMAGHKTKDGHKTAFIREEMILGTLEFDGTKDEMIRAIKEQLQTGI